MSIFNYKESPGYFSRLKDALQTAARDIGDSISDVVSGPESPMTEDHLEDLESVLIGADIGVRTTADIVEKVRQETKDLSVVTSHKLRRMIRREVLSILEGSGSAAAPQQGGALPHTILIVGVNGVGKTTTIGKLARRFRDDRKEVLICAADTFRAAAVEQLEVWSQRAGVEIVKQRQGADPAAVLFDAIAASKARRKEILIVDTAGRLHNKANLMKELEKMRRIASREVEGAPHEVFLILDATTGQNGLTQAREFLKTAGVTGLIVTKLDGTAKGGIVVAIAQEMGIPIRYIGVGEKMEDLMPFSAEAYANALFAE